MDRLRPLRGRLTLRVKIAALVVAIVVLAVGILTWGFVGRAVDMVEEEYKSQALLLARELDALYGSLDLEDPAQIRRQIDQTLRTHPNLLGLDLFLLRAGGRQVISSSRSADVPYGKEDQTAIMENRIVPVLDGRGGGRFWNVRTALHADDEVVGLLRLRLSLREADDLERSLWLEALKRAGAVIGLGTLFLVFFLRWWVHRPLDRIVDAMGRAESGDLAAEVRGRVPRDELGRVAESFNQMMRRIRASADENALLMEQVRGFNEDLSRRVRDATEALERRHEDLQRANETLLETQRSLAQAEKLGAMGQIAATVAHELGTPLHSISGHLQLLSAAGALPAEARRRVEIIQGQIDRLVQTVQGLLNATRRARSEPRPIQINALLKDLVSLTAPGLAARQVEVSCRLAEGLPEISGDPAQLQQVFLNLLTNAADAMPRGGTLLLETSPSAGTEEVGEGVQVVVSDTGVGISPDDLPRIFQPFFTTKEPGRGTGLGLSIVKDIVRNHRGSIAVESRPREGTLFRVQLPAVRGAVVHA